MGGNNVRGEPLNNEENICSNCKRLFTGHSIRSLGGQVACSEQCAERLKPLYPRDRCYGCGQMVWEFSYLTLKDRFIFCNLECLSKYLSSEESKSLSVNLLISKKENYYLRKFFLDK